MNDKILNLTLSRKWFIEILEGNKKQEFREIKKHWINRLCEEVSMPVGLREINKNSLDWVMFKFKKFDYILFRNGYSKDCPEMLVEFKGIKAIHNPCNIDDSLVEGCLFMIELGDIIKIKNIDKIKK